MDTRMELESYVQSSPNTNRFVVEDSITKVTSDGEPHGMMTMVAGLSGLLAAIIILAVLASMVACRKQKSTTSNKSSPSSRRLSKKSMNLAMTIVEEEQPQLAGNLNAAFAESTLTLQGQEKDKEKDSQWSTTPTSVVVQRY
ncbi:uncharacterized protein LOC108164430 [Drosophila miranda]|uniref:uncharacterized protein LOC108164430 n=1 Tax=Drosophila miranda TaxID=7229 RepID=UPI0007E7D342|nr:uncharacterized protein LOC108164430 [Drosophila miranda]XP_017155617.1 uncharacterized protein LOC108164430 [Drosophila miranda]XP_033251778.1 uncharacterized protein LOC108164430 [Drosophila miranda]